MVGCAAYGIQELDNNTAERAMRSVAPSRQISVANRLPGNDQAHKLYVRWITDWRQSRRRCLPLDRNRQTEWYRPADMLARIPDYKINQAIDLLPWKIA